MDALVLAQHLLRVAVVLLKLLDNVRARVPELLLDLLRDPQLVFRRDDAVLSSVAEELLHKRGDVSAGDGDVLDGRANNVTFGLWIDENK